MGQEIRRLRKDLEFTIASFARLVEASESTICDIEHGRRWPKGLLLIRIAAALGVSEEALEAHDTRIDDDLRLWATTTPGIRQLLQQMKDRGFPAQRFIEMMEKEAI